jgi:HYDIN/CFA65/VesB family protein
LDIQSKEVLVSKKLSRKTRRHQRKILPRPLIALGIGGLLLISAAIFFVFQGSNASSDTGSGIPKLIVDQEKIDFGDVKLGENKTFAIKVTNTGDGTLRFKEKPYIQVLEGC